MRHLIAAAFSAFDPRGHGGIAWTDLLIVAAWGAAAAVIAVRAFRWEPSRR